MKRTFGSIKEIKKHGYVPWIILVLAAVIPFAASLKGDFVFDDIPLLLADPFYSSGHSFADCWKRDFWMDSMAQGLYRPITIFSYWLNAGVGGMYSPSFRIVNLIIHVITVLLIFKLAIRLGTGRYAAMLAGILFAVHPLHTEAVIPAFGRGELLCGMFIFLGFLLHTYSSKNLLFSAGTAICLVFACWSKEHGVALIPLCLAYDIYAGRITVNKFPGMRWTFEYILYAVALVPVAVSRLMATGSVIPAMTNFDAFFDNQLAICTPFVRILSAIWIQGIALCKFIMPYQLSHDYSYAQLLPLKTMPELAMGAILLGIFIALPFMIAYVFPRLKRQLVFFYACYVICVLPASNIITPTGTIFGERLFYMPSIWLCLAAAVVLVRHSQKFRSSTGLFIISSVIVLLAARTYVRAGDWHDQMSISLAGVRTSPSSAKTWNNLAVQLAQSGDLKGAIESCDKAISIYPGFKMAHINKAYYSIMLGNFGAAELELRKAVELGTRDPEVYNKLGAVLANLEKPEEAAKFWKTSLMLKADQPMIKRALDDLLSQMGKNRKDEDGDK